MIVRDATEEDAAACAAIYAPYVTETAVSFEIDLPTPEQMGLRISQARDRHALLVLEIDGRVCAYAYAQPFAERAAYRCSCAVSIYLQRHRHRSGGGRLLYEALLAR